MLNRIGLILEVQNDGCIDYNYQYPLLQLIYSSLRNEDEEKTALLHDIGYEIENKSFKLFNFTLLFNNAEFTKENIKLKKDDNVRLILSGKETIINDIVKSLIKTSEYNLDNVVFKLIGSEKDKDIRFNNKMLYKVVTPIVESIYEDGKKYLSPFDNRFYNSLAQNLKRKYQLIYKKEYQGEIFFDIENVLKIKNKSICGIKDKGFVKGYGNFELWIEANPNMQKIAYYCGLGQSNSMGAGMLSYITGRR